MCFNLHYNTDVEAVARKLERRIENFNFLLDQRPERTEPWGVTTTGSAKDPAAAESPDAADVPGPVVQ